MAERSDASIPEITAFTAVAQTGSFTKAAENLGTTKSNVGKTVQRLEARLGTRLFQRTTRAVRLTEDGEIYLKAAQSALDGLREAEQSLAIRRAEPIGRVRVDLPAGFGRLLLPSLMDLRKRYPKVTLELALSDRMSDPTGEGWDIVVRMGPLPQDSDMPVRRLCGSRFRLYASPDYLQRKGEPKSIGELASHDALIFRGPSGRLRPWSLQDSGGVRELLPDPVLVLSDGQALIEMTVLGHGISQLHDVVAAPHIESGRLKHVLPSAEVEGLPVHAIIPLGQRMPAKTRVVLNHLADVLQRHSI